MAGLREKGQSSILLFSQFCGSNEILGNNIKYFPHANCLFPKLKLISVALAKESSTVYGMPFYLKGFFFFFHVISTVLKRRVYYQV